MWGGVVIIMDYGLWIMVNKIRWEKEGYDKYICLFRILRITELRMDYGLWIRASPWCRTSIMDYVLWLQENYVNGAINRAIDKKSTLKVHNSPLNLSHKAQSLVNHES